MSFNFKKTIRKKIVSNSWLLEVVNYLLRKKNKKNYINLLKNCSENNLFEIKNTAIQFPLYPFDFVIDNQMYGLGKTLRTYANSNNPITSYIEHGLFFGNHIQFDEFDYFSNKIITFSEKRKKHLQDRGCKKNVITIGPYIKYSKSFLGEEKLEALKKELGSVLLVFPPHSTKNLTANYNIDRFIKEIENVDKDFDNTVICLYWADVKNKKLLSKFSDKNFRITTAGHKYNPNFLSRLKSIIEISDMTMSGGIGTHIGYCVSMGKPHYIFNAKNEYKSNNSSGQESIEETKENSIRENEIREVMSVFEVYENSITEKQFGIVEKYWGLRNHLSPDEMKRALYDKF